MSSLGVRVQCIRNGRVRTRWFDDRREAWEYAMEQERKGVICFVSG